MTTTGSINIVNDIKNEEKDEKEDDEGKGKVILHKEEEGGGGAKKEEVQQGLKVKQQEQERYTSVALVATESKVALGPESQCPHPLLSSAISISETKEDTTLINDNDKEEDHDHDRNKDHQDVKNDQNNNNSIFGRAVAHC